MKKPKTLRNENEANEKSVMRAEKKAVPVFLGFFQRIKSCTFGGTSMRLSQL